MPKFRPILKLNLNSNIEENKIKWNSLWEQYSTLFNLLNIEYKIDYHIDCNRTKKILTSEEITMNLDKDYKAMGTFKIIEKIKFEDESTEYANAKLKSYNFNTLYNEIENHLELLYLYYKTFNEYKWKFNMPKIYRRDNFEYIMEYVTLNSETWKTGKIYSHIKNAEILKDIGKFLGLYLIHNSKKFFDFELYYTLDKEKVYILDYGFTQKVDLISLLEKRKEFNQNEINLNCLYRLNEFMYNGMIEILNKFLEEEKNFDIICQKSTIKENFQLKDFQQKYLKYKSKYLNLKENKKCK